MKSAVAMALPFGLLAWAGAAGAQAPTRVVGRVTDAGSQAPVAQAEVRAGDLRTVTGADGTFVLGSVTPGRVTLEVRRIGYAPSVSVVETVPGLDRTVRVALVPVAMVLDSVTVVAAPGGIIIDGEALARRGPDLARALDGWGGIVVRRTGAAGPAAPQLRGGGPDEVLVLVDGFAVNDPLSGRADLSRIASHEVERVTLVPGGQTVRAGARAIAGVLEIETRRPVRPEGSTWAGSHGARGLRVGASAGQVGASVAGERYTSRFGYTVPEVRGGGEAERRNAGGSLYTASLRVDAPLELTVRGSTSERGLPGTTTNPTPTARAEDRTVLVGLRREGRVHTSASLQWVEARAADPDPPSSLAYDSYTHGIGGTLALGLRSDARLGRWRGTADVTAEGRSDRFGGDGVREGSSFSHGSIRMDAALVRGAATVVTLAPALRLDLWTGRHAPAFSGRIDAGLRRGHTTLSAGVGSAVTPPVLADLLFREGVGVRLNPDLRPERVRWELEAGIRRELGGGALGSVALRGFYGRVDDMVVWAPDFRFIWSPRNFDVLRRGGELTLALTPAPDLRFDATATLAAVTYDIPDGAQVQYRPRTTYTAGAAWSPRSWGFDLRWHRIGRRFPNSAGTNPRPGLSLLDGGAERRFGTVAVRVEVRDIADARAEFIAGFPTPGRTLVATLNFRLP